VPARAVAPADPLRFYRLGPYRDLVGRSLDDVELGGESAVEIELSGAEELADFDPGASSRPVYLLGRSRWQVPAPSHGTRGPRAGGGPEGIHLAFVLGRRIAAVTQTLAPTLFEGRSEGEIFVLLPEDLLAPGRNELTVFELDGPVAAPRLRAARLYSM
jgi:hypothetical protein